MVGATPCGRPGPAPASTAFWGAVPRSPTTRRQHMRKGGAPGVDSTRTPLTQIRTSIAREPCALSFLREERAQRIMIVLKLVVYPSLWCRETDLAPPLLEDTEPR